MDYQHIYGTRASDYDLLVSREDYQGNLLASLRQIHALEDSRVVEFGAGTGRVTRLLAPMVKSIIACDASAHMLEMARTRLHEHALANWSVAVADNRQMPLANGIADVVIEGWSFGHSVSWYAERWKIEIGRALDEMKRLLKTGGTAIILETMGTGVHKPAAPTVGLATFYQWLEVEHGFKAMQVATDYRFASVEEAEYLTRFFFGDALADRVVAEQLQVVPEYTGLWWRSF